MNMKLHQLSMAALLIAVASLCAQGADPPPPQSQPKKPTVAVLPFVGGNESEKTLAEKMRFAVSQKLSNDADGGNKYDRLDNVQIDMAISALQIPWQGNAGKLPDDDDIQKVIETLAADKTFLGRVEGRKLTVNLYEGAKLTRTATVEIPGDRESPKLTVEKLITDLTGAKFTHIREVEADHSDPKVEERFAQRPNLAPDAGFEEAAKSDKRVAANWGAILGANRYAPPLITDDEARTLPKDRVAIVSKSVAGDPKETQGHCLMMRMSKDVAENNGLACESTWIPVEHGKTYRFQVRYHSTGPVPRLFLKGFAFKPDQFGDQKDPEAVRREFYRTQILPRHKNAAFDLIEMDFTPSVAEAGKGDGGSKAVGMKIEWLRVDLYIYLSAGDVFFDDVVVKKIAE